MSPFRVNDLLRFDGALIDLAPLASCPSPTALGGWNTRAETVRLGANSIARVAAAAEWCARAVEREAAGAQRAVRRLVRVADSLGAALNGLTVEPVDDTTDILRVLHQALHLRRSQVDTLRAAVYSLEVVAAADSSASASLRVALGAQEQWGDSLAGVLRDRPRPCRILGVRRPVVGPAVMLDVAGQRRVGVAVTFPVTL